MPSSRHEVYQNSVAAWFRERRGGTAAAAGLRRHADAAAVLWSVDLEPARPVLERCYARKPRGGRRRDPVMMLRLLLLALLARQPSLNRWVQDVRADPVLRVLAGVEPADPGPGVGTYYDFLHRLHDGPVRTSCEHVTRPSELERRRSRSAQPARRGQKEKAERSKPEARGRRGKGGGRKKRSKGGGGRPAEDPLEKLSTVSAKVATELRAARELPNPDDLLGRLASILLDVAVLESSRRGLLGKPEALAVGGDGSPLVTGADRHGRKTCQHGRFERCDCPRLWSDPDARVGWDPHRDRFFFGHHLYELSVSSKGHDLPLAIRLDPGNTSDFVASLLTVEHFTKLVEERGAPLGIETLALDAGHDSEAIYRYCLERGIKPVIPLSTPAPAVHPRRASLSLSSRGVPLCEAGAEMTPWGSAGPGRSSFVCPVKAGKLAECPKAPPSEPGWRCQPATKHGPVVVVKVDDSPRLCPPTPRNSATYARRLKLRSGCERSFAAKKGRFALEAARHRRQSFWLIRVHAIAILQHAQAWVGDAERDALVARLLGEPDEPQRCAA